MMNYLIDDKIAAQDLLDYIEETPNVFPVIEENLITFNGDCFEVEPRFNYILRRFKNEPTTRDTVATIRNVHNVNISSNDLSNDSSNSLIFGQDDTKEVVAVEVKDDKLLLFKNNGEIEERDHNYWLLSSQKMGECIKLDGDLDFKYLKEFSDKATFNKARGIMYGKRTPMYNIYDPVEASMVRDGITLFKGLKVEDVSVLSFDIETTGLTHDENSKVLMISNTYRDRTGKIIKKLFALDEFEGDDVDMILEWCKWIREIDPSIMIGHNIFGFDLSYLSYCVKDRDHTGDRKWLDLILGKDGSPIKYSTKAKKFRKDGSQTYDYFEAKIFGRQLIDTFFLAIKYDFGRKYESYGLKQIIEQEGMEKKGRIKWDFEKNSGRDLWTNLKETKNDHKYQKLSLRQHKEREKFWNDFKEYCKDDADDSLKLYDLMIPSFFYYMRSLPMSFQTMNNTATGRQINGLLVRSYLQLGHSVPKPTERKDFEGAISFGNPGVYSHVKKEDVAALYPSIVITEKIYDIDKDPKKHFLTMVEYFTKERLENKKKGKETGDRYFKDMEQSQKIVINSAYGLLGASGLNFNSPDNAEKVTRVGREILTKGIEWVKNKGFQLVNVDTDSFSYTTGKKLSEAEYDAYRIEINELFADGIRWEDDGYFKKFMVVKAKNYVLDDGKGLKIKGSGLKGTMKEKALQQFMKDVIVLLMKNKKDHIYTLYQETAHIINNIENMEDWCMKKTITKAVLNPERMQEQKVFDAIQNIHYQEGDKVYLYSKDKDTLKLRDEFDGEYNKDTYFQKLHDTLSIFETLVDPKIFPNFKLSRNRNLI